MVKTICVSCGKTITNNNYSKHVVACMRPKVTRKRGRPIGSTAWNKGLTKETNEAVRRNAEMISLTTQKKIKNGTYVPNKMGKVARQKLSEIQSLENRGGRSKWYEVNGQKVQGTYEKQFAECLSNAKIEWIKIKTNNHIFSYVFEDKTRSYAPDFYLPKYNLYVEIKGFWWGNDENKMKSVREQHRDKNVVVIFGKQKLDEICKNVTMNLQLVPVWSW